MASFVLLLNWTDQGVRNFRDTLSRATAFEELVQKMGGQVRELLWTVGPHDVVAVLDAPDDGTVTSVALSLSSLGNVQVTTLRAFNRDEMAQIVERTT